MCLASLSLLTDKTQVGNDFISDHWHLKCHAFMLHKPPAVFLPFTVMDETQTNSWLQIQGAWRSCRIQICPKLLFLVA